MSWPSVGGAGAPRPRFHASSASTVDAVTVWAGIVELLGDLTDCLLVSGLWCFVGGSARFSQFIRESNPIRIRHGHGPAVFARTAGCQHQLRGICKWHRRVVDNVPSGVDTLTPGKEIDSIGRVNVDSPFDAGIDGLHSEDDIRSGKQQAPHQLSHVAARRQDRHRSGGRFRPAACGYWEYHLLQCGVIQHEFRFAGGELPSLQHVCQNVRGLLRGQSLGLASRHGPMNLVGKLQQWLCLPAGKETVANQRRSGATRKIRSMTVRAPCCVDSLAACCLFGGVHTIAHVSDRLLKSKQGWPGNRAGHQNPNASSR